MNYELAKKLKDAGFPMKETFSGIDQLPSGNRAYYDQEHKISPTLSELIEACGDKFEYLNRVHGGTDSWFAGTQDDYAGTEMSIFQGEKGSTPEEAVANLWLDLNRKSS